MRFKKLTFPTSLSLEVQMAGQQLIRRPCRRQCSPSTIRTHPTSFSTHIQSLRNRRQREKLKVGIRSRPASATHDYLFRGFSQSLDLKSKL